MKNCYYTSTPILENLDDGERRSNNWLPDSESQSTEVIRMPVQDIPFQFYPFAKNIIMKKTITNNSPFLSLAAVQEMIEQR